jgi:hypothetical protein
LKKKLTMILENPRVEANRLRDLAGYHRISKNPQNEKTRQKAGFRGVQAISDTQGALYGAGTRNRTRDLLITSQLLYQLSYTGG